MTQQVSYGGAVCIPTLGIPAPQSAGGAIPTLRGAFANQLLDATGEKFAMIGSITWSDRGTHTVSSSGGEIILNFGSVTFANGGTTIDVGLEDVPGSGREPDDTFDVKGTYVGGTDTISANASRAFAMETGTKSVAHGDILAVVVDMVSRAGADAVNITTTSVGGSTGMGFPYSRFHNGTSWGGSVLGINALIKSDDGTYGWMTPFSFRTAQSGAQAYGSTTGTADEYGGQIRLPWPCVLEGMDLPINVAGQSSDFEVCIYSTITGTPALLNGTVAATVDASRIPQFFGDNFFHVTFSAPKSLDAGTTYGWSVRPTSANAVTIGWMDFGSGNNAHMASLLCGPTSGRIARLDNSGAFTVDDTKHCPANLYIRSFGDDAGGGGGSTRVIGG